MKRQQPRHACECAFGHRNDALACPRRLKLRFRVLYARSRIEAAREQGAYTLGPSTVLPTGRAALTCSGISVFDFLKRTSLGYLTKEGFLNVREATGVYAMHSELVAHAIAVTKRKI